jgi:hypothetical protein
MEATELVMQCAMANQKKHNQKPSLFCQILEMAQDPPRMCKAKSNSNGHV